MKLSRRSLLATSLAGAACSAPPLIRPATAQGSWPTGEPIKIIVAYPPGGGTDMAARGMIPHLERQIPGARFVVVNRPGATGELGHAALAAAPRDGYTFGLVVTPSLQTVAIERTPRYRIEDFTFLGGTTEDPGAFYVKKDSPIRNLRDLMERAKAAPDRLSVATSGVGSDDHLLMLDFQDSAEVRLVHVPFAGQAPTLTALLAGHVDVAAMNVAEGVPGVREGQFRCLAQASSQRSNLAMDTPTFKESGFNVTGVVTRGFAVPTGTPVPIVTRLSEAIAASMRDPAWLADAERMTLPLRYWSAAEYTQYVAEQDNMLRRRWRERPWGSN
jgi:tripartite-type tricarboxylate transporter receptor subunit TctC